MTSATELSYNPATGEIGTEGQPVPVPSDGEVTALTSRTGGSSAASGCKAIQLTNSAYSAVFGSVLFRYITVTSWCWNRAARTTSSVGTSWRMEDVSSTMFWRGEVNKITGFFSWVGGYGSSGYRHYRQGSFENCLLKYGCIGIWYPSNDFRAHSDGTYWFSVQGADN